MCSCIKGGFRFSDARVWYEHQRTVRASKQEGQLAKRRQAAGQATVEGAFLIPIIFLLLLMLLQPGILLYDRVVMQGAAAEACRMLATRSEASGADSATYEEVVRRHLGAIPQQENFHCHNGGCSWQIELNGNEHTNEAVVRIAGKVKLLPLLDFGGTLLGLGDGNGVVDIAVECRMRTQDSWVEQNSLGMNPSQWVQKRK